MDSVNRDFISMTEIIEVEERLSKYRNLVKEQGTEVYFLESQIDILEMAVFELKKKLIVQGDRSGGGIYEYTLQAVVTDIETQVQNIIKRVKEK
ncbi:MAG: hypothetical protein IJE43_02380 [Alphaproteobacteria bacterium]|nr:hypothetical protein [Alphaproteobacteria bacterium]